MSNYSGSGLALFEYYNNQYGKRGDSIILFRDEDGTYCLPGGKTKGNIRDSNSTIYTAKEETFEETCCLFSVSENTLSKAFYYDKTAGSTFYRCYALKISSKNGIQSSFYHQNRNIINHLYNTGNTQFHDYLETDDMVRVFIHDIPINSKACDGFVCFTAKERKKIVIKPRDSLCIQYLIRKGAHRHIPHNVKQGNIQNGLSTYFL